MKNDCSIAIVGAGNVATHLSKAFKQAGAKVCGVAARSYESARKLAEELGAQAYDSVEHLPTSEADFILISTTDSAVGYVAARLKPSDAVVLHTSGSIEMSVLQQYHKRCGVLYPLQTFSKGVAVDISAVPFFIEGDTATEELAKLISSNVYHADSKKRKSLHIAGVLTSNFPIYLLQIAERVLAKDGFPLEVVRPLIDSSIAKAFAVNPEKALTGPARRGDLEVVERHIAELSASDSEVYRVISNAIIKHYHK